VSAPPLSVASICLHGVHRRCRLSVFTGTSVLGWCHHSSQCVHRQRSLRHKSQQYSSIVVICSWQTDAAIIRDAAAAAAFVAALVAALVAKHRQVLQFSSGASGGVMGRWDDQGRTGGSSWVAEGGWGGYDYVRVTLRAASCEQRHMVLNNDRQPDRGI
jgi:hypothetical protein